MVRDEDIRRQLRLGEDSGWEFKEIVFAGDMPTSPRRGDLADELGAFANAAMDLYTTHLPMTIHAAGRGYAAGLKRAWTPNRGGLLLDLEPLGSGGAAIFAHGTELSVTIVDIFGRSALIEYRPFKAY